MSVMSAMTGSHVRLSTRSPAFQATPPKPALSRVHLGTTFSGDNAFSSFSRSPLSLPTTSSRSGSQRKVTTMAAKVTGKIKLALTAGKANPAPPVGPALGSKGVNIMAFCKEYNAQTAKMAGQVIPVEITVYEDRSFTFILKTSPASVLLKKAAGIEIGSGKPNKDKVGKVTRAQVLEIAKTKLPDTNATKLESVVPMIEGTAKNMGITIVD
ncbi:hypothetical protein CEUSTIGMA_g5750.t1 [Chlamydomonas eustigma]|uniref:Large ribosomal subunit protein uL11c n=1 Tax=Chlamydomonas eustigma TaxID=1157962 RepID=A0A250X5H0_9CHLO|nr:hypothetical protein CEUSTIGMA_g5750.t1 [Chlamydomonas eustigma]|eukprot:GAX78308.1 hypothetical protein CEUSTIGMA_g5750.t1 [Chlamydomonas eustigma]